MPPSSRFTLRVLDMQEKELRVAATLSGPQRNPDSLNEEELREKVIKWLFSKNLSLNHEFVFEKKNENSDELLILMGRRCSCCPVPQPNDGELVRYNASRRASGLEEIVLPANLPGRRSSSQPITALRGPAIQNPSSTHTSPKPKRQNTVAPIIEQPTRRSGGGSPASLRKQDKKEEKKEEEKPRGSCCGCLRECGLFCVNLWSNL